jgi:hypothetical protein
MTSNSDVTTLDGDPCKPLLWRWRVRAKPGTEQVWFSTKRWKELRWGMTEEAAAKWGEQNGCEIQKIEGSAEQPTNVYGDGRGYGGLVPKSF